MDAVIEKHQEVVQHGVIALKGGASMAVSGGLWAWFGANHSQIGALCAMVGATCALLGLIYSIARDSRGRYEEDKRAEQDDGDS